MGEDVTHKLVEVLDAGATACCAAGDAEGRAVFGARNAAMLGVRSGVGPIEAPMMMGLNCDGWGRVSYKRSKK